MDNKKAKWQFARYNYQKTWSNPRIYCMAAAVFLIYLWYYKDLPSYLAQEQTSMNVFEMYILNMNSIYMERYVFMGFLLLICDIPFLESGLQYYMLRSHRKDWLAGQFLYIGSMIVLYNLFIFLVFAACTGGHISFTGDWGEVVQKAMMPLQDFPDVLADVSSAGLMTRYSTMTPLTVMGISFLWSCLWMFAFSAVFFALVLFADSRAAWIFIGYSFLLDIAYRQDIFLAEISKWVLRVSPLTFSRWMDLGVVPGLPSMVYALAFFLLLIVLSLMICRRYLNTFDIELSKR
ncbi:MAG: hypothetical protein PUB22_07250 [Clostridiales bacterium]|nr:hypothetical protein [Clostridiales bacterium]